MFELSKRISSYLVRCGFPKKNEAIYPYGIEILLNCSCTSENYLIQILSSEYGCIPDKILNLTKHKNIITGYSCS